MFKRLAVTALFLLAVSGFIFGQQSNARIIGTVTDAEGNPLPGVSVEATSPKLVGKATTITDDTGTFRLLSLSPGEYKVVFSLEGFQTKSMENVLVTLEQTINLKIAMQMGKIDEFVTVTGAPLIDVKTTAKGQTLTRDVFSALPKGRNFDTLTAILPGVTNETQLNGISIDGSSGGENIFYIDGTDVTNVYGGTNNQSASFEFVDEVQVKASGYQAEFGGSLGGVINVITRTGGNEFHGEAFGYWMSNALDGIERDTVTTDPTSTKPIYLQYNYATDRKQETDYNRFDVGFGLGGYIVKDKVWFYGNVMPVMRNYSQPTVFLYPDTGLTAFDQAAWLADMKGYQMPLYTYKRSVNDINAQIKITAQPAKSLRLSLSFVNNYQESKKALPGRDGTSSDAVAWDKAGYKYPNYSANLSADYTIGNNAMASVRVGYFFANTLPGSGFDYPTQSVEPLRYFVYSNKTIPGITEGHAQYWQDRLGQQVLNPDYKDIQRKISVNGDFSYYMSLGGEHAWKAGFQFVNVNCDTNTLQSAPTINFYWGSTSFGGTRGYIDVRGGVDSLDGPYGKQYGQFGKAQSNRWALYLQDSWTISKRFTLNFGLRAESENVPSFNTDDVHWAEYVGVDAINFDFGKKLAPRLGFVWDVAGDSSLKVYGSYGMYHDTMELDMAMGSFGGMRWISTWYNIFDSNKNDWKKWGVLQADGTRYYPESTYYGYGDYRSQSWGSVDPDIKPMSQSEITVGAEKRLTQNLSLSVRGTWRQLLSTIDDVGVFVLNPSGEYSEHYYIANPGYGVSLPISQGGKMNNDYWPTPKAQRDYKAVNIELTKRLSNNWMGGVNLTLSRLYGNYTGIVSADESTYGAGRASGNVCRYFDVWWMSYLSNGKQETANGLLPTDRPVVAKIFGSYHFPFGLTVGMVANWMRGNPITSEWYVDRANGFFPWGRGDLGRTPDLYFVNLSAEYNLKIGKNTLQLNVNVDNVTDVDTATFYYRRINTGTPYIRRMFGVPSNDEVPAVFKAGFDPLASETTAWPAPSNKWYRDPRYNKADAFYGPYSGRIGVKFIF